MSYDSFSLIILLMPLKVMGIEYLKIHQNTIDENTAYEKTTIDIMSVRHMVW